VTPSAKAAQQIARDVALQIVSEYKGEPLDFDFIKDTIERGISASLRARDDEIQAQEARIKELEGALASGYRVYKDGASWCAVGSGFMNLQESKAGFGETPLIALGELIVNEGE
jgi:hypothetical protein